MNYYKVLELDEEASYEEIKSSYKRLAMRYHPDVNDELDAAENFRMVRESYEFLRDREKRAKYDYERNHNEQGTKQSSNQWSSSTNNATEKNDTNSENTNIKNPENLVKRCLRKIGLFFWKVLKMIANSLWEAIKHIAVFFIIVLRTIIAGAATLAAGLSAIVSALIALLWAILKIIKVDDVNELIYYALGGLGICIVCVIIMVIASIDWF